MHQGEGEVLVEEVAQEFTHADVGPAPVDQQEALQVTELSEGVVAGHHSLHPLLTADAHTDVCSCTRRCLCHSAFILLRKCLK